MEGYVTHQDDAKVTQPCNIRPTQICTGYYLNLFDEFDCRKLDIFLIFSEGNNEPTVEDVEQLTAIIKKEIAANPDADRADFRARLEETIDNSGCPCVEFGFQLVICSHPSDWIPV